MLTYIVWIIIICEYYHRFVDKQCNSAMKNPGGRGVVPRKREDPLQEALKSPFERLEILYLLKVKSLEKSKSIWIQQFSIQHTKFNNNPHIKNIDNDNIEFSF